MHYQTFNPSDNLIPIVKCYWTLEGEKEEDPEVQTIIPDGCMEMIFHYGDLYQQHLPNGNIIIQPRCFVIGQLTRPLKIQSTGTTGIFSIRFNPGGFASISNLTLTELQDKAVSLTELFGQEGALLSKSIIDSDSVEEKINLVEDFILHRIQNNSLINDLIKTTIDAIIESKGRLSVAELSDIKSISRRSLERRIITTTGFSPKKLSKIIRLQSILRQIIQGNYKSFTDLAYVGEYYDQSHFIKDFKDITGMSPKAFYGENLKMSSLFYGS